MSTSLLKQQVEAIQTQERTTSRDQDQEEVRIERVRRVESSDSTTRSMQEGDDDPIIEKRDERPSEPLEPRTVLGKVWASALTFFRGGPMSNKKSRE